MPDLLEHWNLQTRPFEAPWDTRFFFAGRQHSEALDRLLYLVGERSLNIGVLTGETGSGKTLTRAMLQRTGAAPDLTMIAVENCACEIDELVALLLIRLDPQGEMPKGRMACLDRVEEVLESYAAAGHHVVLLLDEAQEMSADTLASLRWLTNFNGDGRPLLTIVLIGQTCLAQKLQSIPAIEQRIGMRYNLQGLAADEVPAYLAHRLRAAGHHDGLLFDAESADLLYKLTHGMPREINRLAKLTLEQAWLCDARVIDAVHVTAVASDLIPMQAAEFCHV